MPELPEVETIKNQLEKLIIGKKIKHIDVFFPNMIKTPLKEFKRIVLAAKIKKIRRRAKILIIDLDKGWSLLNHLKMTGQIIFNQQSIISNQQIKNKHTHIIYTFSDGSRLSHSDLRRFGWVKLIKTAAIEDSLDKEFGPEPLDKKFTFKKWREILIKKPKARIKQFLMDQKNIAGIGNIYADEILFVAGVHPSRRAESMVSEESRRVFRAIKRVLSLAVKLKGTSARDYLDARGQKGNFEKKLKVYGREGKKCVKCRGSVKRIKIGGRSAHFCPVCQRLES